MRLSTLQSFHSILAKRFASLDKSLSTSPKTEILTIRTMINTIMNEPMTPANAQKLGDLGRKYNEILKLQKRQELHWDEWQKERRALATEIAELDETIKLKTPPTLFDSTETHPSPASAGEGLGEGREDQFHDSDGSQTRRDEGVNASR